MIWTRCIWSRPALGIMGAAVVFGSPAGAFEISAPGLDSIMRGDLKSGISELERSATRYDAGAALLMYGMHRSGYAVPKNFAEARRWLALSERRPIGETLYAQGMGYYFGRLYRKDMKKAFSHLRRAASRGNTGAQYYVGKMYVEGIGTTKDTKRGITELLRSSKQGSAYSNYYLARMFKGKTATITKEYRSFLTLSAIKGLRAAQFDLYRMYYRGEGVLQDYRKALYWGRVAAGQGSVSAQNDVGFMFSTGKGTKPNKARAFRWYKNAAERGSPVGAYNTAVMYRFGTGVRKNLVLAHMWYNLAASRGYTKGVAGRDKIARTMRPNDVSRAQRLARAWTPRRDRRRLRLQGGGTGFFVNFSHGIATNEHVVSGCAKLAVRYDGRIWDNVSIIAARKDVDLALLSLNVPRGQSLTHGIAAIAPPNDTPIGEVVSVLRLPLQQYSLFRGRVYDGRPQRQQGAPKQPELHSDLRPDPAGKLGERRLRREGSRNRRGLVQVEADQGTGAAERQFRGERFGVATHDRRIPHAELFIRQ